LELRDTIEETVSKIVFAPCGRELVELFGELQDEFAIERGYGDSEKRLKAGIFGIVVFGLPWYSGLPKFDDNVF
jgi:hypothetical protein